MKNLYLLLVLFTTTWAFNQANPLIGVWKGKLTVSGTSLNVLFHFEEKNGAYTGLMDSPDQGAFGIPLSLVEINEFSVLAEMKQGGIGYKGKWQETDSILGVFSQGGKDFPLNMGRITGEIKTAFNRPQEPKGPFPYIVKEVEINNTKDKVTLAGTLTIPKGKGPFPAVILVSGSGPQDRNEEIMGHKPFLVIADYLTRNGIAVLRFDDRGVGKSSGNFSVATSSDFSKDAEAGFAFLQKQKNIDPKKVGILGHSEGGMIAPMVASRNKSVDFIILLAGPGIPIDELMRIQVQKVAESEGADMSEFEKSNELNSKIFKILKAEKNDSIARKQIDILFDEYLQTLAPEDRESERIILTNALNIFFSPWYRYFISFEPEDYLKYTKCPVLVLNGEKDVQVTSRENLEAIEQILRKAGNENVEIHSLPNLNHLFQTSTTGAVSEYSVIEETISEGVLELVKTFILR